MSASTAVEVMVAPRYTALAKRLPASVPFVGPEAQERARGEPFTARIGANENAFGPSPRAIQAMQDAARGSWKYGDPENFELRRALADHHSVRMENIVVGEGIDGLLGYLCRLLVTEGTPVVTSLGAYPTFNYHVEGFGGELFKAPYQDDAEDPRALLELGRAKGVPLIYFANPDNPMGTWHHADVVQGLIDGLPGDCLLCLDEAYIELAPPGTAPPVDVSNPAVIRFRTFSKAYGLAGARIGYAVAHADVVNAFNKVRNHFGVNCMAQAGALAALRDQGHVDYVQEQVRRARERIAAIAGANGFDTLPSAANFVAVDCGRDGSYARALLSGLSRRGVFVRMPQVSPQDRCIRVSAGTIEDLDVLERVLPQAVADLT